jgi:hypothetical protein
MGGDFQQTLPIIPKGSREQILDATITRSYLWNDMNVIHLHQNMRLRDDHDTDAFAVWLLKVGRGENCDEDNEVEIPQDICSRDTESLMNSVYPDIDSSPPPPPDYLNRIILAPRNSDVNDINENLLDRMTTQCRPDHFRIWR